MKTSGKVIVGLSGGLDSSVTLLLLKEMGYEPVGVTLYLYDMSRNPKSCCGIEAINTVRRITTEFNIPFYLLDYRDSFRNRIMNYFINEYKLGRTPNPCALCNRDFKFDILMEKAQLWGTDFVATGHYARIEKEGGKYIIKRAYDKEKDQSYFLSFIKREILSRIIFPLGNFKKQDIKSMARKYGIEYTVRPESQDVCFIKGDYREFLKEHIASQPGEIKDIETGKVIGSHSGVSFYTIGQRKGLRIAKGYPLYVASIDAEKNEIRVGRKKDIYSSIIRVVKLNWLYDVPDEFEAQVKIRYRHTPQSALVKLADETALVRFKSPQWAPTPGQTAAFYWDDILLGGGVIAEVV